MTRKLASDYDEILKLKVVFLTTSFWNKQDIQNNQGGEVIW